MEEMEDENGVERVDWRVWRVSQIGNPEWSTGNPDELSKAIYAQRPRNSSTAAFNYPA
jgi:hypothetical protein